jgi:2-amino-4-hydroxy-6-hydroxymethyldihydropteridine diphosphokinase
VRLLLGFGGNLGDPALAFRVALAGLGERHPVLGVSRLYSSHALGPPQPDYLNLVALIRLRAPLLALLEQCQLLEVAAGRERSGSLRWGPRPLDIDLLAAEAAVHCGPRLQLPHPRFLERAFAVVPAAELAPTWVLPGGSVSLGERARALERETPDLVALGPLGL